MASSVPRPGLSLHLFCLFCLFWCSPCSFFFRLLGLVGGSVCSAALAGPPLCCCSTFLMFVSGLFGGCRWLFCCSIFSPTVLVLTVQMSYLFCLSTVCLFCRSACIIVLPALSFYLFCRSICSSFFYRSTVLPILPFLPTCLFSLRQGASSKGKIHFACKLHGSGGQ